MMRLRFYLGTSEVQAWDWYQATARMRLATDVLGAEPLSVMGATLTPGVGLWNGGTEPTTTIELLGDYSEESARAIAEELRQIFSQDSVLWTLEPIPLSGSATRPDPKGTDHA